MPGFLRRQSRPQGDRFIKRKQKAFDGGMNVDMPSSELDSNQVPLLHNYRAYRDRISGETGSLYMGTLPGSGTVHAVLFHPQSKVRVVHRGSNIYAGATEITDYVGASLGLNVASTLRLWDEDMVLYTGSGIYHIAINSNFSTKRFRKLNASRPATYIIHQNIDRAFLYRYIVVYSTIITSTGALSKLGDRLASGNTIVAETPSVLTTDLYNGVPKFDYGIIGMDQKLGSGLGNEVLPDYRSSRTIALPAISSDPHHSGYSIYRTMDLGSNGVDSRGVKNNPEVYIWIDDVPFVHTFTGGAGNTAGATTITVAETIPNTIAINNDAGTNKQQVTITEGANTETFIISGYTGKVFTMDAAQTPPVTLQNTYTAAAVVTCSGQHFYNDVNSDEAILRPRLAIPGFLLRNRGWDAMPDGDIGDVTDAWLVSATRGKKRFNYCQLTEKYLAGYHNIGRQYEDMDDGIQILQVSGNILSIIMSGSVHNAALTSFVSAGTFRFTNVLDNIYPADRDIGCEDYGSFAQIDANSFIAVCSDDSVRIWNGVQWSLTDYSQDKVRTEIEQAIKGRSVGAYFRGVYYLWYSKTSSDTITTSCMRLSLKRESGRGWAFRSGTNWIYPPFAVGAFVGDNDAGINIKLLQVFNSSAQYYWIEHYKGPTGIYIVGSAAIKKYFKEKIQIGVTTGGDIQCKVRSRDLMGEEENFNIKHSEAHLHIREADDVSYATSTLEIDAVAYIDNNTSTPIMMGKVKKDGDISFYRRVEGSRLQTEFISNRSAHDIVSFNNRCRVQDRKKINKGTSDTIEGTIQTELVTNVEHYFTRPDILFDRGVQQQFSSNGKTYGTAPDDRSKSLLIGEAANPIVSVNTKVYNAFTAAFAVTDPTFDTGDIIVFNIRASGVYQNLSVRFNDATTMELAYDSGSYGTVTVVTIAVDGPLTNGFHHFMLVKVAGSTSMKLYQNNALKGTFTVPVSFGGGSLSVGAD